MNGGPDDHHHQQERFTPPPDTKIRSRLEIADPDGQRRG